MKLTKRKGFNFFRSYYDVFNELPESDKLIFIEALLDKQFLGIDPVGLTGLAKFAWISQVNSIDSQVKGFEDKTGLKLTPTEGGAGRVELPPTEQVEGKGKEEVEDKPIVESIDFNNLLLLINQTGNRSFTVVTDKAKEAFKARLQEGYTKQNIKNAIHNAYLEDHHKESGFKWLTVEFFSRQKTLDQYGYELKPTKAVNTNPVLNREDFFTE